MGRLYLLALSIAGLVTVISVVSGESSAPRTAGEAQADEEPAAPPAADPAPPPWELHPDGGPD